MLTAAALALLLLGAPKLEIPAGKEIRFDGAVEAEEWADAWKFESKTHDLRIKRTGPWLCVGMAGRRSYSGEVIHLTVSDAAGAWQTLYLGMLGLPTQPPALRFHGTHAQYVEVSSNPKIPMMGARGTLCRLRLDEPGRWSGEYRIRLTSLGIGRGDLRKFKARLVFADGTAGDREVLVLPEGTTPRSEVEEYADLVSPDGWGAGERWEPVTPEESAEFDDVELLGILALEQQEALRPGEIGQLVISTVVRPRNAAKIETLRKRLEAGRRRNPGLPAWRYFLARLLHEANRYEEAGRLIDSIPEPLRGFGAFVHLAAEHLYDTGRPDEALALCRAHPRVYGIDVVFQRAMAVQRMLAAEKEAEEAAKKAGAGARPIVRFTTAKGSFEVELFEDGAPHAVTNFIDLVLRQKYYDGVRIHEAQGNVAARTGDPRTRTGAESGPDGPGWRIKTDAGERKALLGRLLTVPIQEGGQHGSQFVFTLAPVTHDLSGAVVFGRVIKGLDVMLALEIDDRFTEVAVVRKRSHKYDPAGSRLE